MKLLKNHHNSSERVKERMEFDFVYAVFLLLFLAGMAVCVYGWGEASREEAAAKAEPRVTSFKSGPDEWATLQLIQPADMVRQGSRAS